MPFTLAHPVAVLPLARCRRVHFPAMVIGSLAPDFVYFLHGRAVPGGSMVAGRCHAWRLMLTKCRQFCYNAAALLATDKKVLIMRIVEKAYTFDDVLLVPAHSQVLPKHVSLQTRFGR